jgi:hypothetical protein
MMFTKTWFFGPIRVDAGGGSTMPGLRLAKLPDRNPVKISISVPPDLHAALTVYADAYQAAYGSAESVAELIPYMLTAFIEGDGGFRKARRGLDMAADGGGRTAPRSRAGGVAAASAASTRDLKDGN